MNNCTTLAARNTFVFLDGTCIKKKEFEIKWIQKMEEEERDRERDRERMRDTIEWGWEEEGVGMGGEKNRIHGIEGEGSSIDMGWRE